MELLWLPLTDLLTCSECSLTAAPHACMAVPRSPSHRPQAGATKQMPLQCLAHMHARLHIEEKCMQVNAAWVGHVHPPSAPYLIGQSLPIWNSATWSVSCPFRDSAQTSLARRALHRRVSETAGTSTTWRCLRAGLGR
eukprot:352476-Chlamydomonas_euryale.AAC.18